MTSARNGRWDGRKPGYAPWLTADVVLIVFFALLGHLSHYGTLSPPGVLNTALPFFIAYLAATVVLRAWRRPTEFLRTALPLWLMTAAGGLILRVVLGESAAVAFHIVALCVLGLFLLVPRGVAVQVLKIRGRRAQQRPTPHSPSRNQGAAT